MSNFQKEFEFVVQFYLSNQNSSVCEVISLIHDDTTKATISWQFINNKNFFNLTVAGASIQASVMAGRKGSNGNILRLYCKALHLNKGYEYWGRWLLLSAVATAGGRLVIVG